MARPPESAAAALSPAETATAETLPGIASDLAAAYRDWLEVLRRERRLSRHTLVAYARDVGDFLRFLPPYLGEAVGLPQLGALPRSAYRAWLAARGARGLIAASNARGLSALKSFSLWLARQGRLEMGALAALRGPKLPQAVPKPLNAAEAEAALSGIGEIHEIDWLAKRDLAILTLLYGCGLRISEALALNRGQAPASGSRLRILGKGRKMREVPVLPIVATAIADYLAACPYRLAASEPYVLARLRFVPVAAAAAPVAFAIPDEAALAARFGAFADDPGGAFRPAALPAVAASRPVVRLSGPGTARLALI